MTHSNFDREWSYQYEKMKVIDRYMCHQMRKELKLRSTKVKMIKFSFSERCYRIIPNTDEEIQTWRKSLSKHFNWIHLKRKRESKIANPNVGKTANYISNYHRLVDFGLSATTMPQKLDKK